MKTVKVRKIEIGSGVPKICVPIVGVTKDEIIAEAKTFDSIPVDVVEWRVDWFEGVFEFDKVEDVLKDLREALGETPILFTFRTSKEGGEKAIEAEPYKELNIAAAMISSFVTPTIGTQILGTPLPISIFLTFTVFIDNFLLLSERSPEA